MKKIFLLIVLFCASAIAQKIKEDDGQILYNGVAILKVEKEKSGYEYKYTDLKNSTILLVTLKTVKIDAQNNKSWLIVKNSDGSKSSEINFELLSFTLNYKKGIAEILAKKHNVFTENGIENLDNFFSTNTKSFSNDIETLKETSLATEKDLIAKNFQVFPDFKMITSGAVPSDAFTPIYKEEQNKDFKTNAVGIYELKSGQQGNLSIEIFNIKKNSVLTATVLGGKISVNSNNKNLNFVFDPKTNGSDKNYYANLIKEIVEQSYLKQDVFVSIREFKEAVKTVTEDAKLKSRNLYGRKGFGIDKNGVRKEGKVFIEFEKIDIGQSNGNSGMVDLDGIGNIASLHVLRTDGSGTSDVEMYKVKNDVTFGYYNDDNTETIYKPITAKIQEDLIGESLNLNSLMVSNSRFFCKEVYKSEKFGVYESQKSKAILIKTPTQENGFHIFVKNGDKNKFLSKLNEYLGGKFDITELGKIDFDSIDGIKSISNLLK
jgi:hypothetical protein